MNNHAMAATGAGFVLIGAGLSLAWTSGFAWGSLALVILGDLLVAQSYLR